MMSAVEALLDAIDAGEWDDLHRLAERARAMIEEDIADPRDATCWTCGCRVALHDDLGCHGRQRLTPFHVELCVCGLDERQAATRP